MLACNMVVQADALNALHRYGQALRSADEGVSIYQALAAERPAKYAFYLACAIDTRSRALAGLNCYADAISAIGTAIRTFENLAVAEPGEYLPVLAEALTCMAEWLAAIDNDAQALAAARDAIGIYWQRLQGPELPHCAARAAILAGRLLCQRGHYREATRMLARGWTLAASQQQHDVLGTAAPALRTARRADPADFATVWQAETGGEPPGWLTTTL